MINQSVENTQENSTVKTNMYLVFAWQGATDKAIVNNDNATWKTHR